MTNAHSWLSAARLRTLPLAVSGIVLGNCLALEQNMFNPAVALMALLTAILLQVLSNLANDYGDTKHGADNADRFGPERMVSTGAITAKQMKKGVIVTGVAAFIAGVATLYLSIPVIGWKAAMLLLFLGIASIVAAYAYTASSKPYGYEGFGDVAVLFFFGLVSVGGSYALQTGAWDRAVLLPALSTGLFSTGVLNINNLRDQPSDAKSHKKTIPVRLGLKQARVYHEVLLGLGCAFTLLYAMSAYEHWWQYLFLLVFLLFVFNGISIWRASHPADFAQHLKKLAIYTFLYSIVFGLSLVSG